MKSEDVAVNTGFPALTALRLAHALGEFRMGGEFHAWCEPVDEFPDEHLVDEGRFILDQLHQLVKEIKDLGLEKAVEEAEEKAVQGVTERAVQGVTEEVTKLSGPSGVVRESVEH